MKHTLKKWLSVLLAVCLLMALAPSALMEDAAEVQEEAAETEATESGEMQEAEPVAEEEASTPEGVIVPSEEEVIKPEKSVKPSEEEAVEPAEVSAKPAEEASMIDEEVTVDAVDEIVKESELEIGEESSTEMLEGNEERNTGDSFNQEEMQLTLDAEPVSITNEIYYAGGFSTNSLQQILNDYSIVNGYYWGYNTKTGNSKAYTGSTVPPVTFTWSHNTNKHGYTPNYDYAGYNYNGYEECWGLAYFLGAKLSGIEPTNWTTYTSIEAVNATGGVRVGDIIRARGHSAIVYKVNSDQTFSVVQCGGSYCNVIDVDSCFGHSTYPGGTGLNTLEKIGDLTNYPANWTYNGGFDNLQRAPSNSSSSSSAGYTAETAYFERCTYKIVKAFNWRSGPSSSEANAGSASVGETFTTDRVIWNKTTNNMWVKKAGEEKYVFAGLHYSNGKWSVDNSQTQYLQFVSNDATVNWSGCNVGGSHKKGEKLALQGSITCSNSMKSVQGQFYNGSSPYGNSTSKFGAGGTTYSVPASSLDYALTFGSLPASNNMKLVVTVEHYYNRGQSVGTKVFLPA